MIYEKSINMQLIQVTESNYFRYISRKHRTIEKPYRVSEIKNRLYQINNAGILTVQPGYR